MTEREKIERYVSARPEEPMAYQDALALYKAGMDRTGDGLLEVYGSDGEVLRRVRADQDWHDANRAIRAKLSGAMRKMAAEGKPGLERMNELYYQSLLMDAKIDFDSFMLYLEKNRNPAERFYLPRRQVLKPIVAAFQEVADGMLDLLTVSQPKRTGKTTVGTWFVLFRAGQSPNGSSVCSGAGDMLVKSFYVGMLDVLQQKEKYAYYDIFPEAKLVSTNADEKTFNLKEKKRFATVTCRPIDGQITGSTEATPDGLIYLDDTVKNEEEAVNRDRLDFLWDKVRGDILGRRIEGCPIVAQGTRYSLYDPIGRLQEVAPNMGWRTKVLEIPALNENDESNFEITQNGKRIFTSAYYQHERELVTEMQWESQFQQHPFEAKGRLFPENALNRYFELPPNKDPDTVVAVCDTAEKGTDSVMMPIAYVYGEDIYIEDCVFNNGTPQYTKPECAHMLIKHKVITCTFESNSAGEYFGRDVEKLVKDAGYRINIRMKRTISNKQNRIENASDGILKHFYFKDRSLYTATGEYGAMIRELTGYTRSGKVAHDDAPDGLSLLENELRGLAYGKVEVFARPW